MLNFLKNFMLEAGIAFAQFKGRLKEILAMKKQVLLLLGLILLGTLGLAAGIEASKGNWDYRSLSISQGPTKSEQALVRRHDLGRVLSQTFSN
jgi:hypothetical protein